MLRPFVLLQRAMPLPQSPVAHNYSQIVHWVIHLAFSIA
jgi:hypothetical protein